MGIGKYNSLGIVALIFLILFCIEHNHFRVSPGLPAIYNSRRVRR